ncbi:hypothetical protein [Paludisphaera rhizosphaerae]|uniref:hypothetical protein n=1 Tax=Paludisphaera rhizosphaerae TaxID=2711216 RepID=UPI0013EC7720|nr:hypothetical protein [Paludisphaera rhizosphaerae]
MTIEPDLHNQARSQVVVVLHERSGVWARQLRARLDGAPVRWAETRSTAGLLEAVIGDATPVVLIEGGPDPEKALREVAQVVERGSSPLIMFIDPFDRLDVMDAARDLGVTRAVSGRVAPPEVAELIGRWIGLSAKAYASEGWSRPRPADPSRDPSAWIEEVIAAAAQRADC